MYRQESFHKSQRQLKRVADKRFEEQRLCMWVYNYDASFRLPLLKTSYNHQIRREQWRRFLLLFFLGWREILANSVRRLLPAHDYYLHKNAKWLIDRRLYRWCRSVLIMLYGTKSLICQRTRLCELILPNLTVRLVIPHPRFVRPCESLNC